jgi:hypothetical protein
MGFIYRDIYSKVYNFSFADGPGTGVCFDTAANAARCWYDSRTVKSKTEPRALIATNTTASGISFNTYFYGSPAATAENYLFFSENAFAGITTGAQRWIVYGTAIAGGTAQIAGHARYSSITMPDGSTNGIIVRTENQTVNSGIYQAFPSTSVLQRGKIYTFSAWVCGDSGGGQYTSTPAMRFSYFSNSGPVSLFSSDIELSSTPVRHSWTFMANETASQTAENIAISCGSGSPPAAQLVVWGAQLVEGNSPGEYLPTSTNWNKYITSNSVGSTTTTVGTAGTDFYRIESTSVHVPANSSVFLDIAPFTVGTNNLSSTTRPNIQIYGLY